MKDLTPFTCDNKPAVILPNNCRYTKLLIEKGHRKSNLGAVSTVTKFCMNGFWTPQAIRQAKKVRSEFVICRLLDKQPMNQQMGSVSKERLVNPGTWSHVEIDLKGPFVCCSDVNKCSTTKVWGAVLEDINSGAVYSDIVSNYSTEAIILMLKRFLSICDWPRKITSDP